MTGAQTDPVDERAAALERAHQHTLTWLASLDERPVPPQAEIAELVAALGTELRSVEALRRAAAEA